MAKCSFCGGQAMQSRAFIFVDAFGKVYTFCSSKCKNNWRLGRDAKKLKWVRKTKQAS